MSEIKENQQIKLSFKVADGSEKELECTIKNIYKDRLSLNCSNEIMNYAEHLQEGDEVRAEIFTPTGIKMFEAIILNSPLEYDFVIEFVENFIEIQRRKYVRADLKTKVIIERTARENVVTQTLDIGGGGIRFFYEGRFDENEKVNCLLYLPMYLSSIKASGIIIKDKHLEDNEHVLVFTKIDEKERDKVIKKCLELQSSQVE